MFRILQLVAKKWRIRCKLRILTNSAAADGCPIERANYAKDNQGYSTALSYRFDAFGRASLLEVAV